MVVLVLGGGSVVFSVTVVMVLAGDGGIDW